MFFDLKISTLLSFKRITKLMLVNICKFYNETTELIQDLDGNQFPENLTDKF